MRDAVISFPMLGEDFNIDPPSAIQIGGFSIYFYGIIIAFGMLLAFWYTTKTCRRFGMTMDGIYDYLIWALLAAVVGARLYYCLTYTDASGVHTYLQNPAAILRIRDGGLAIYGGVIGAVIALLFVARHRHESVWKPLDVMGVGMLIGQCVGRGGNFFNREAFGYETEVFCRMGLTLDGVTIYVHPMFLYESLWNLLGFLLLHFHSKKRQTYYGQHFLLYLMWYGLGRMCMEGLRSDSLWLVPGVIRISQLLAALALLLAAAAYLVNARRIAVGVPPVFGAPLDRDDIIEEGKAGEPFPDGTEEQTGAPSESAKATNQDTSFYKEDHHDGFQ
ncbi:MAG: prolipoprotein diacylglyceryl transferase [Oscillospiraceae bacterium]|nr:prolipoprotein diacylglyceryl transferase [Oscillospiraceae bacterium]